jgi:heme-degrading monooxygenase HmoA
VIAQTPKPPYYAVIFSSVRTPVDDGYANMAEKMVELAGQQPGFLGVESARNELGITISYWNDLESIKQWKHHAEHSLARDMGRSIWYEQFRTRIARVERDYEFFKP